MGAPRVPWFEARRDRMVEELAGLVGLESPTDDVTAVMRCASAADDLAAELLGRRATRRAAADGREHLVWDFSGDRPPVVIVGHLDTVWPLGTTARWPFRVDGDVASGPGTFDMKAGVVVLLHALASLDDLAGVRVLLTTDEETGSPTSRALVEECARGARAALVCEGPTDGAVKTARKGVSIYALEVVGRAAHAGVEPERGVNATVELARQVVAVAELADASVGTTVTPTSVRGGTTTNTVPASATVDVDVRAVTAAEQLRVDAAMRALGPRHAEAGLVLHGGINRPPLERAIAADLYERARRVQAGLGLGVLREIAVGGGSDGNFTAAVGTPTLDGLGAVGGGAHAEGEHVLVSSLPQRAALLAGLVDELRRG